MPFPWLAAASIGGSLIGGLLGKKGQQSANTANLQIAREQMQHQRESQASQFGFEDQQAARAMQFSDQQAQRQMKYQERMSNSAYQRAMTDMKKAGLNPMLAYTQGGASVPGGASGSPAKGSGSTTPGASAVMKNEMEMMAHSVSDMAQKLADIKKTEAETKFIENKGDISGPVARTAEMVEGAVTGAMDYLGGVGGSTSTAKGVMKSLDDVKKWIQQDVPKAGQNARKSIQKWKMTRKTTDSAIPNRILRQRKKGAARQSIVDPKTGKIYFFASGKAPEWAWHNEYLRSLK